MVLGLKKKSGGVKGLSDPRIMISLIHLIGPQNVNFENLKPC